MFAITGITGRVGGIVARPLLTAKAPVRAVVRDAGKGAPWLERGCELALAEMNDAAALAAAFEGAEGIFVLANAVRSALEATHPSKVVCISTIGAQATRPNLLTQLRLMEQALGGLGIPITFLRPAWFMENAAWDVASARNSGVISSFLQPLDKPFPTVATADVGRTVAKLLQETWTGRRTFELEGPRRVSPNDIAAAFSRILGRPVRIEAVPRESWEDLFKSQGMKNPAPRVQMLDGFNEGWIDFEGDSVKGEVELETVLKDIVERAA